MNPPDSKNPQPPEEKTLIRLGIAGGGEACFSPAAARLLILRPDASSPNLLWTHPDLSNDSSSALCGWNGLQPGGPGGDRLWCGPEYRYFWDGPPEADLSNWRVPTWQDPGTYTVEQKEDHITFAQEIRLPDGAGANIERGFSLSPSPAGNGLRITETTRLHLTACGPETRLDLWRIQQTPAGSCFLIPTLGMPRPGASFETRPGDITRYSESREGLFTWRVSGQPMLKGFFPVTKITGQLACLRQLDTNLFGLTLRTFQPRPQLAYDDALLEKDRNSQCVQWWDGLGYGEIECHSPTATARHPEIDELHTLDAWIGPPDHIRECLAHQLDREIPHSLFPYPTSRL
jgi:hypothetical protein